MPEQIDTSLSPSIDPGLLDAPGIADQFTIGMNSDGAVRHAAWTTARSTMEAVFAIGQKLSSAERSIQQLGDSPDSAMDARLRRGARQQMQAASKQLADSFVTLAEHANVLEAEADNAIGTPQYRTGVVENSRAAEVRTWLRSMPPSNRTAALEEAVRERDSEIVASVLAATPMLSGMKRGDHAALRLGARTAFAPEQDRIIGGIEKIASVLKQADQAMLKRFASITGEGNGRAAAAERALTALEGGAA